LKIFITFIFLLLFSVKISCVQHSGFNHSKFDKLLKIYVDEDGKVDYEGFKNCKDYYDYLSAIQSADISALSQAEKLAFFINAYNAIVIKNVIDHFPIISPMDVKGFFNKIKHKVFGKELTLDELEHNYALKIEPLLTHFGLVCAAKSCPKLLQKAYNGNDIYEQLESNFRSFLNDSGKNRLDRVTKTLYLSEIFGWFKDNFVNKYGSVKEAVAEFMNEEDSEYLMKNDIKIKYILYNWNLNKQ